MTLLGIPGDNTYSNYQEATRTFWRSTVLPLVNRTAKSLSAWLSPAYGGVRPSGSDTIAPHLELRPDLDSIEALSTEREALWTRIEKATFLTPNEKRSAVGYGPIEGGGNEISQKYSPDQPRVPAGQPGAGQWTDGGGGGHMRVTQGRFRGRPPARPTTPVPVPPGVTIRNQALAGKRHLDTGIPFDNQGFPDFSSVTRDTATFPHTGNLDTDRATANRQRGYSSTPPGMVWHHHQDGRTMQLVPEDIHTRTGHTGSRGIRNLPGKR